MQTDTHHTVLPAENLEASILRTLAYFGVFQHPLTVEELLLFGSKAGITTDLLQISLDSLTIRRIIYRHGDFYLMADDVSWIDRRRAANLRADKMLPIASRIGRFIGGFPFVHSVFISGSLSKHTMAENSDVDFFIVTAPGRLWLTRSLLILFKKVFLLDSHRFFCVNYFVDTANLEIAEKNLFTATEAATLIPVFGRDGYNAFCLANPWVEEFYPNIPQRSLETVPGNAPGWLKKVLQWMLNSSLGTWLDDKAMDVTVRYWRRKFSWMDSETFAIALKSNKGVSKHHPLHFQQKVLEQFQQNLQKLTAMIQNIP